MRWFLPGLWFSGLILAAVQQQVTPAPALPTPAGSAPAATFDAGATRPSAAAGLAIYDEHCVRCHGPKGAGDGDLADRLARPPASLSAPETVRQRSPEEAFDIVSEGRLDLGMPPWKQSLSEAERWAAVYGAWSFYFTPDRLVRGRSTWKAHCAACHGPAGDGLSAAPLADPAWLAQRSQQDLFTAARALPEAHPALAELPDDALWSALDHVRSFGFEAPVTADLSLGGRVAGRIENGTAGDHPVAGTRVRLVPMGALALSPPLTTTVAADGQFAFADLLSGPEARYGLVASHQGVDVIFPEALDLSAERPTREDLVLRVYETATDVPLRVRSAHLVLSPDPEAGLLRVAEVWVVANESDRARVAGADSAVLRLPLPSDQRGLRLEDARMRSVDQLEGSVLVDRVPVPPGEREIVLSYDLPYSGTTAQLARTIPLATGALRVMAVGDGVEIVSPQLPDLRTTEIQGRPVVEAAGSDLAEGASVAVAVTGLPPSSGAAAQQMSAPAVRRLVDQPALSTLALLLGGLALAVALLYPELAVRRQGGGAEARLVQRRSRLVDQLAELDRRHRAGQLGDAEHAERRTVLMQQAIAVSRELSAQESAA